MSPPRAVVVDANVALKWVFDDEDAVDQAVALRDDALEGRLGMVAPSIWVYELTNGLVSAERRGRLDARAGRRSLVHLLALGVEFVDPEPGAVFERAIAHRLSAYDAAYVALAGALGAPFWSGDRSLCAATGGSPTATRWIGDYGR